jgi:hypothetical protein
MRKESVVRKLAFLRFPIAIGNAIEGRESEIGSAAALCVTLKTSLEQYRTGIWLGEVVYKLVVSDQIRAVNTSRSAGVHLSMSDIRTLLMSRGWAHFSCDLNPMITLPCVIGEIGSLLGLPVAPRGSALIQSLVPTAPTASRSASMSAKYGLRQQPWHIDLAHWPVPARFIVFGCESTGNRCVPTEITDCSALVLNAEDTRAAYSQPYLVSNGRESFYSTMLDKRRSFVRLDPACMLPRSDAALLLQRTIQSLRPENTATIEWEAGDVLVLDNWKVAHRRLDASNTVGRRLLRVSVMERT